MRLTGTLMEARTDDFDTMCDHATDARIRLGRMKALPGQAQCMRHVFMIGCAEKWRVRGHTQHSGR
jgi:hypothetical protein